MMKLAARFWIGAVAFLVAGISFAADDPVETPNVPKPGYLKTFVDPVFGSAVTRITGDAGEMIPNLDARWDPVARHGYSKDPAWNCDQSMIVLKRHNGFPSILFLDGASYEPIFGRNKGPGTEARWDPGRPDEMVYVEGNTIGRWNVRTDEKTSVATFSGYDDFHIGPWEGNLSRDGKLIAIVATKGEDRVAFAFDLEEKRKYPDLELNGEHVDWVSVSPSGKYLVLNGKIDGDRGDQTQIYDLEGNKVGKAWTEDGRPSHYDLTIDADGEEVAVGVSKSKPDMGKVIKRRLSDGAVTALTSGGFAGHTSTRNVERPGWAYMTYQYQGEDWLPYRDEVVAVKLDGSLEVERIAHLHAPRTDYLTEAHVIPSPDGERVLWASAWGEPKGRPVSAYVARRVER